jgi:hypothetical protein
MLFWTFGLCLGPERIVGAYVLEPRRNTKELDWRRMTVLSGSSTFQGQPLFRKVLLLNRL